MLRARVTSYEHELGDWTRARRTPDVGLSGLLLDREPLGYQHSRAQFAGWLEPPRPQLDPEGNLRSFGTYDPYASLST